MAVTSQKAGVPVSEEPPCPDPALHTPDARLQDTASKAAMYVTHGDKESAAGSTTTREANVLGPDGKLSSASAATSLKYAKPQDLPGFPSVGIDTVSSGNKAASHANSNQRTIEPWRPEMSASASKAALLAARDGGKLNLWQHQASETGFSAAGIAMSKQAGLSPNLDYGHTEDGRKKALLAATMSISGGGRNRSSSNPTQPPQYPDQQNATYNALNAATVANRPGSRTAGDIGTMSSPSLEASRIKHMHSMSREMYTEHPPVAMEVEEKQHQQALRASAISMARQMYEKQQTEDAAKAAGLIAANRSSEQARTSSSSDDAKSRAMAYVNLQEAAQKLAAERLAKLDPDGVLAYREHYGYPQTAPKSRLSFRGRHKKTRSGDGADVDSDDEEQAGRIRSQMNQFNEQVASVDAKKRTTDRENLLAAAQRSVQARMQEMDDKVFLETGKIPPSMMEEWTANARAKAMADSEKRMENHGKVHIGGGKFMDQAEVDAIAQGRMQPTLDEITERAEMQRARDEEIRLDIERRKAEAEAEKEREREVKAELKRQRDEQKQQERALAAEQKAKAAEEKEQRKLQERMAKAEQKQIQDQLEHERKLNQERAKELEAKQKEEDKQWLRGKEGAEIERERNQKVAEQEKAAEERELEGEATADKVDVAEDAPAGAEPIAVADTSTATEGGIGEDGTAVAEATEIQPLADEPETAPEGGIGEEGTAVAEATEIQPLADERAAAETSTEPEGGIGEDGTAVAEASKIQPLEDEPSTEGGIGEDGTAVAEATEIQPLADEQAEATSTPAVTSTTGQKAGLVSTYEDAQAPLISKRDSKSKGGFFSRFKRSSRTSYERSYERVTGTDAEEDTTVASGALAPAPAVSQEDSSKAAAAEPLASRESPDISPASSVHEAEPQEQHPAVETEEAKDQVEELAAPRASFTQSSAREGSPARTSSKFQEEL